MSADIYLRPGELSPALLRKAMNKVDTALQQTTAAFDEQVVWGDAGTELFTSDALSDLLDARCILQSASERLASCASLLSAGSEEFAEIDRSYRAELKEWKRSGDHTRIGWQFCPASVSTDGTTVIGDESATEDGSEQNTVVPDDSTSSNGDSMADDHTVVFVDDHSSDVTSGRIRYVDQTSNLEENGWGNTINRPKGDGHPGWQCNSACESMALSYLGIDREPGTLAPIGSDELGGLEVASMWETKTEYWTSPDGRTVRVENFMGCNMDDINARVSNYKLDCNQGNTAPVMIHYVNGGKMHWVLLTGKNEDGTFNVIGPGGAGERGTTVTIDSYGNITGASISHGGGKIDQYAQYTIAV